MSIDPEACLTELRGRELLGDDALCVFASGSIVRGWGNAQSDFDLYVASAAAWTGHVDEQSPVDLDPPTIPVTAFHVDDVRWDVEYWQSGQIDQLFEKVSWSKYDEDDGPLTLSRHEIDFLERLPYADALVGAEWLQAQNEALKASAVRPMLVRSRLNMVDIFTEDAVGQLMSGDQESAVLSARQAFAYAVDALTAHLGEIGHSIKWRARRVRSVQPAPLSFEDYWTLETMVGYDPAAPDRWVEKVLEACQRIVLEVVV